MYSNQPVPADYSSFSCLIQWYRLTPWPTTAPAPAKPRRLWTQPSRSYGILRDTQHLLMNRRISHCLVEYLRAWHERRLAARRSYAHALCTMKLNAFVSILSYALLRFTSIERYSMLLKNSSSRRRNYLRMWIVFIATSRPWRFHHYPLPYRLVLISPQPPRVLVWRHDELLNSRTKRANIGVDEQLIIGERYIGSM